MKTIYSSEEVQIPDGIKIKTKARNVIVSGKRGTLKRSFKHLAIDIKVEKNKVIVGKWFGIKKELAAVRTVSSHIQNMIKGVTSGFRYKMKSVYAHFPINMNVIDGGKRIEIRNFLGEKFTRNVSMLEGVTVAQSGVKDEIQLDGNNIETVSRSAALIQQSVKVKNKDIRKFLDGIYVSQKTVVEVMDD